MAHECVRADIFAIKNLDIQTAFRVDFSLEYYWPGDNR